MDHYYKQISGWCNFEPLYSMAVSEAQDGDTLLETGTWFGCSAAYLGVEAINSGKKLKIITIDNNQQYADIDKGVGDRTKAIKEILKPLKNVKFIDGDSLIEAGKYADGSLRMVFLDALHEEWFVAKEMRVWYSKVMQGGIFSGHDIDWSGVHKAVNDFCNEYGLTYQIINSSWIIRK